MRNTLPFLVAALFLLIMGAALLHGDKGPQVTVIMPKDAKPLSTLTEPGSKVVGSDRATLWWTVYKAGLDKGWNQSAIDAADHAVKAAYGPLSP